MRLLCLPCYERGKRVPAVGVADAIRYGVTARCADCHEAAGEARDAADFAAFHGGGYVTAAEREATARAAK